MSKSVVAVVVAVLASVCVLRQETPAQQASRPLAGQWEYKVVIDRQTRLLEPQLRKLGAQGWELVTVCDSPDSPEGSQMFVFKKPAGG
jgi:hypothetical protein